MKRGIYFGAVMEARVSVGLKCRLLLWHRVWVTACTSKREEPWMPWSPKMDFGVGGAGWGLYCCRRESISFGKLIRVQESSLQAGERLD